jgi:hypothetical protein
MISPMVLNYQYWCESLVGSNRKYHYGKILLTVYQKPKNLIEL